MKLHKVINKCCNSVKQIAQYTRDAGVVTAEAAGQDAGAGSVALDAE